MNEQVTPNEQSGREEMERRATGVQRVPVSTVVEICGRESGVPAFEAESVELSGRGMQVRTPYLPKLDAPLVCRLDSDGREIIVEGVVAWRKEHPGGGQFGIKFTALDSGSVGALKLLCGIDRVVDHEPSSVPSPDRESEAVVEPEEHSAEPPQEALPVARPTEPPRAHVRGDKGLAVKLHIDGLGAPMKARVQRGSVRKLQVGSNLEFLKVGRELEIEDVELGERYGAEIDTVSVSIDPQTQIPQLVVSLRYEGAEETTPEPSVVDVARERAGAERSPSAAPRGRSAAIDDVASGADPTDDEDGPDAELDDEDEIDEATAVRERLAAAASLAATLARSAGSALSRAGAGAAHGARTLAGAAGSRLAEVKARRQQSGKGQRRVQGLSASGAEARLRPQTQRLRPQKADSRAPEPEKVASSKKKLAATAAAACLIAGGLAYGVGLISGGGGGAGAGAADAPAAAAEPAAPAVEAIAAVAVTPAEATVAAAPPAEAPTDPRGISANVPLFGPKPMATLEPAPLGSPPDDEATDEADEMADVADESFDDEVPKQEQRKEAQPEAVKPWGSGRLYLPVIHRIELDRPGQALSGKRSDEGFSVVIPGRKAKDLGKVIARRDNRIASVKVDNGGDGARITFRFRGKIPAYKVRLRKRNVEFFISSPEAR